MTTEAELMEVPVVEATATQPTVSMEEQERQLGETAKATFFAAGVKKKAAREEQKKWDDFFAERGVNPQMQIDRLIAAGAGRAAAGAATAANSEQVAVGGAVPSQVKVATVAMPPLDGKEGQFIMKYAEQRKEDGFTLDEIAKEAVAAKVVAEDSKENRQPFYKLVMGFKDAGKLSIATAKRDDKTVFILPPG